MQVLTDNFVGLVAIILIFGLPVIAVVMAFIKKMKKNQQEKEIRQLIIENKTDPETAKLLIEEPKKAEPRKPGTIDLGTLRTACILLGVGLGTLINWLANIATKNVYFWLIIAFGVGIGMLCSFLVELRLAKKQKPTEDSRKED